MKYPLFKNQSHVNKSEWILHTTDKKNNRHPIKHNVLFLLTLVFMLSFYSHAQRGVRIAYIDTEYILENVPEYQEATAQLEEKAQKWKNEIQAKLATVAQKRKDLSNEKALLTKELIDEREEDITFEENEILDYQQKRFGPNGDLFIQKKQLMQPIQDQIESAVEKARQEKLAVREAKVKAAEERRQKALAERAKAKQDRLDALKKAPESKADAEGETTNTAEKTKTDAGATKTKAQLIEENRQKKLAERLARKKALDERKRKIIEDRQKAKDSLNN